MVARIRKSINRVTIQCTRVAGRAFFNGQITRRNRVIGVVMQQCHSWDLPSMKKRTKIILIATPIALIFLTPVAFFAFWILAAGGSDAGSPKLAAEWRDDLAKYPTPDAAIDADTTIEHVRFPNGDWLIGRAQDSHGMWRRGGGTVVIKDSNGDTRVFFGHVCGGGFISWGFGEHPDLISFYNRVSENEFTEYNLP